MRLFVTTKTIFLFLLRAFCYQDYKQKGFHFRHAWELLLTVRNESPIKFCMAFLSLGDHLVDDPFHSVFTRCGNLFTRFLHLIPHGQQSLVSPGLRNWVLVQRGCAVAESDQTLNRLWSTSCSFSVYIVPSGTWSWVQILTLLHTSRGPWANHLN